MKKLGTVKDLTLDSENGIHAVDPTSGEIVVT